MKYAVFVLLLLFSCRQKEENIVRIRPNFFIEGPGRYSLGTKEIRLKEFTDGTLIFFVGDSLNRKVLYQQSIIRAFSKYHKYLIYIDNKENIWCYNGDLQDHFVLLKDSTKGYIEVDYKERQILPPAKFLNKI